MWCGTRRAYGWLRQSSAKRRDRRDGASNISVRTEQHLSSQSDRHVHDIHGRKPRSRGMSDRTACSNSTSWKRVKHLYENKSSFVIKGHFCRSNSLELCWPQIESQFSLVQRRNLANVQQKSSTSFSTMSAVHWSLCVLNKLILIKFMRVP